MQFPFSLRKQMLNRNLGAVILEFMKHANPRGLFPLTGFILGSPPAFVANLLFASRKEIVYILNEALTSVFIRVGVALTDFITSVPLALSWRIYGRRGRFSCIPECVECPQGPHSGHDSPSPASPGCWRARRKHTSNGRHTCLV